MKCITIYTFLISYFLISCSNSKDESIIRKENTKTVEETEEVVKEINYEPQFKVNTGKFFKAYCQPLCDDRKGKFLDREKMLKYESNQPYDIRQTQSEDSIYLQFDIIEDCCLDYVCNVSLKNKTIYLSYSHPNDTMYPCDCACDYRMFYVIKKQQIDSISIWNETYQLKSL